MPFSESQKNEIREIITNYPLVQVPLGTIIPFGGELIASNLKFEEESQLRDGLTLPEFKTGVRNFTMLSDLGWLPCDGKDYNYYNGHPLEPLARVIGHAWGSPTSNSFRVPDLRGMFLRGADKSGLRDKDFFYRVPLYPGGFDKGFVGSYQDDEIKKHTHVQLGMQPVYVALGVSDAGGVVRYGFSNTQDSGGSETRPKNVYVNYIIKASYSPINYLQLIKEML